MSSIIRATTTSGLQIAPDNSGSLILQTNGTTAAVTVDTSQNTTFAGKVTSAGALTLASNGTTTALTIDTSQNVGIGTTSPNALLHVSNAAAKVRIGVTAGSEYLDISRDVATGYSIYNAAQTFPYRGHIWQLGGTEAMRIDSSDNLLFNSGYGSVATAYGCRAWIKFNGTGTPAINGSGNVTSITDNGTGDYTINFTTALADTNYSVVLGNNYNGTGAFAVINPNTAIYSTAQVKIQVVDRNGSAQDTSILNAAILR